MTAFWTRFNTALCPVILAGDASGLTHVHLESEDVKRPFAVDPSWHRDDVFFTQAREQIEEYCQGTRTEFNLALNPSGTQFQKNVWNELARIPYGVLRSYGEIALALGIPKGARAVGAANGKNPLPLVVPCHRVVGTNGNLTGFAHGLGTKEKLLRLEGTL